MRETGRRFKTVALHAGQIPWDGLPLLSRSTRSHHAQTTLEIITLPAAVSAAKAVMQDKTTRADTTPDWATVADMGGDSSRRRISVWRRYFSGGSGVGPGRERLRRHLFRRERICKRPPVRGCVGSVHRHARAAPVPAQDHFDLQRGVGGVLRLSGDRRRAHVQVPPLIGPPGVPGLGERNLT